MVHVDGIQESYALLQVWSPPPNAPPALNYGRLGVHAIAFTGLVDLLVNVCTEEVSHKKQQLDDIDDPFTWDLNVTVGPEWREIVQVAPLVVVADVFSSNPDEDDNFQAGVEFGVPKWASTTTSPHRIVLHVRVKQAGEFLAVQQLSYSVTATGSLSRPGDFVPQE